MNNKDVLSLIFSFIDMRSDNISVVACIKISCKALIAKTHKAVKMGSIFFIFVIGPAFSPLYLLTII